MAKKRGRRLSPKKITRLIVILSLLIGLPLYIRQCNRDSAQDDGTPKEDLRPRLNQVLTNEQSAYAGLEDMDRRVEKYMKRWELNGLQIAVSRHDSLVYAKGFGWAEKERAEAMTPGHIMRVASVSKLLTAAGIMKLRDEGKLRLDDLVFGPEGVLNDSSITRTITDPAYFKITVEHLLRHQGGFTNRAGDPMFSTRYIMMQNHLQAPPDNRQLLDIVLKRRLGFAPGTAGVYSNFGYMLLSLIIERCSGMTYEEYMQEHVFRPAGCFDFHIAGNYYEDRYPNEVKYYMHTDATPVLEFDNSGREVVKCYGENNIPMLLGAGAWCASAAELCHFIAAIDGDTNVPDILSRESVDLMTDNGDGKRFSLGWNRTPTNAPWIRTGTLSGTSSLVLKYPDGECWVLLMNTSTWKGQMQSRDHVEFVNRLRSEFSASFKPLGVDFIKPSAAAR